MFTGFIFAAIACFIWGTIFVIPQYLQEFSSFEVALGRYFFYGLLSSLLFFKKGKSALHKYPFPIWKKALKFAIFSNILYYPALVVGIRNATAPIAVLMMGICPILVALYGNFKSKECSYKDLISPAFWIFLGIFLVNATEIDWSFTTLSPWEYLLGLFACLIALFSWSFFAVSNARFLKNHPEIPRGEWSTMIGVTTFACTTLLLITLGFFDNSGIDFSKFLSLPLTATFKFLLGATFLGVVCSWIGCYLWNEASSLLPISVMGPLIIFETIFGLFFVFLSQRRLPTLFELLGILAMLWGIMSVLYLFRKPSEAKKAPQDLAGD